MAATLAWWFVVLAALSLLAQGDAWALFDEINAERDAALAWDDDLARVAEQRSADMVGRGYFGHDGGVVLQMLRDAEIEHGAATELLARTSDGMTGIVATFMASPPHRAALLDMQYTRGGIGVAVADDGMRYYTVILVGD